MDLKGLVDKAKEALRGNPSLIDKGGDAIDRATGGKYADQVDKAQDAARKAVGAEDAPAEQKPAEQQPAQQPAAEQKPAGDQQPPA